VAGYHLDLTGLEANTPEYEYYEGFMVVDFVPTSEHLSSWMAELVQSKMKALGVTVQRIEWWETPKSRSVFYRDGV
jgi:6-pyruvoyltetrahydropterin/6-carboxytetrahydropterin synthase